MGDRVEVSRWWASVGDFYGGHTDADRVWEGPDIGRDTKIDEMSRSIDERVAHLTATTIRTKYGRDVTFPTRDKVQRQAEKTLIQTGFTK